MGEISSPNSTQTSLTMSYESDLQALQNERIHIDERSLFKEALKPYTDSNNNNIDPTRLNEVIKSYNEKFETFKGVFLEQESKEQFLKLILEQDTTVVTQQKILDLKETNMGLQTELNNRKIKAEELSKAIESQATLHDSLNTNINNKISMIDTLNNDITSLKEQSQQIKDKYGDSLDIQDPILQTILEKLSKRGISTSSSSNLHNISKVQRQTAEITRIRLETQKKIDKLLKLKQSKITDIKMSKSQNIQLKATQNILSEEIEEIKKLNSNIENLEEKKSYERNNENLTIIKSALSPLSTIEKLEIIDKEEERQHIIFSYKSHPDIQIVIVLHSTTSRDNQTTDKNCLKISNIICPLIKDQAILLSIKENANHMPFLDQRINEVTKLLYGAIIGSRNSV